MTDPLGLVDYDADPFDVVPSLWEHTGWSLSDIAHILDLPLSDVRAIIRYHHAVIDYAAGDYDGAYNTGKVTRQPPTRPTLSS